MKLVPLFCFLLLLVFSCRCNSAKKIHQGTKKPCTKHKHHLPLTRPTAHPGEQPVTELIKPSRKAKTPCTRHNHRLTTQVAYTTRSKPSTTARPVTTACKKTPCGVSKWSKWSICSSLCGNNGVKQRSRKVMSEPTCGGTCDYLLHEVQPCNKMCLNGGTPLDDQCKCQAGYAGKCCQKVNGKWSPWGKWSQCSRSCGNGNRQRMRTCDNPSPANGGSGCQGDSHETVECSSERECPVNGGWSLWGPWSPCSTTCGQGQKFRLRMCSNPFPRYGGRPCLGLMLLTSQCQLQECRTPGNAGSGAVGKRHVINRRLLNYVDRGIINNFEDIVQRNLEMLSKREDRTSNSGPWTSWSSCSVTCGTGQRFRSRACQDLANPCVGIPMEVQTCEMGECSP